MLSKGIGLMCIKCLNLLDELKQWVTMLDGYELDIAISKQLDSFWYKQKLAELILLLEIRNGKKSDYLRIEYSEIKQKLIEDQQKLERLVTSPNHRFQFNSINPVQNN
jgi:hypothetical protein